MNCIVTREHGLRWNGEEYSQNREITLPDNVAESLIKLGYVRLAGAAPKAAPIANIEAKEPNEGPNLDEILNPTPKKGNKR